MPCKLIEALKRDPTPHETTWAQTIKIIMNLIAGNPPIDRWLKFITTKWPMASPKGD